MSYTNLKTIPLLVLAVVVLCACSGTAAQSQFTVITHPDGRLYVGDQVSFEVLARGEVSGETISVSFDGQDLGSATIVPYGIGERLQATFWWIWDTSELKPGRYSLTFTFANGYSWQEEVSLRASKRFPESELEAVWDSTVTDCCIIHYITGTDAARDLADLAVVADKESAAVAAQFGTTIQERIDLVFIPRVIGHGGFAWNGVYISYLDENYVGSELDMVLHHEFVHYYDSWVGGEFLPAMLREGLAVYYSGGHFKPEPIAERAAALLELGWFIPLETLADDFYNQQHDIGYLEAAALVQYVHETYGPGFFAEFYRTITYQEGMSDSQLLDVELQQSFSLSLAGLEAGFISYLSARTVTEDIQRDLELTIADYDLVRRYQSLLDPSAYFLAAWLPDGLLMRERGIVADFTRRPVAWQNLLVEGMLRRANTNLFAGEYEAAEQDLKWTNRLLDILDR